MKIRGGAGERKKNPREKKCALNVRKYIPRAGVESEQQKSHGSGLKTTHITKKCSFSTSVHGQTLHGLVCSCQEGRSTCSQTPE